MSQPTDRLTAALSDRYRIERELGAGGMATVYLAEDLKHDRKVAVKVLRPDLAAVVGGERFVTEIRTTANLQHPNILPLFDSGEADGFLFYVMPYVEGESLRERLERESQLPVDEAVGLAVKVANALDAAHEQGVIHRDIKPANILLSRGEPLVADFGIALAVQQAGGGRLTETGLSLGTPYYMSPEQATGEQRIGPPADVYALGCVLYEMLVGEPPFGGGTAQAVLGRIISGAPVTPTAERPSIPANVDAAIRCALEKLPADRFRGADDFARALRDPGFRHGAEVRGEVASAGVWKPLAIAASVVAGAVLAFSVAAGGGAEADPMDVGLPLEAPMAVAGVLPSMAVSDDGRFVVYEAERDGARELWYRSLESFEARPIPGTRGSFGTPFLSPDGSRVAFFVQDELRVTRVDGEGSPSVVGSANAAAGGRWREDGTLIYSDQDGRLLRFTDPESGPLQDLEVEYCLYPTLLAEETEVLCGGGAWKFVFSRTIDAPAGIHFWTRGDATNLPGANVRGAQFRVVDEEWLVYVAIDGTLMATRIEDFDARTVGRSVSMVSDVRRQTYTGAGQWGLTRDGTLVYAIGRNGEVGRLVELRPDGEVVPLPVEDAAYLRYEPSPDGSRLASVVEAVQGQELRVHDLRTGTREVVDEGFFIGYPAWSPDGGSLVYTRMVDRDDGYVLVRRDLDGMAEPVELLSGGDGSTYFQPSSWLAPDSLLLGVGGSGEAALMIDPRTPGARVDTLPFDPFFAAISPDRRWIAWAPQGEDRVLLQSWPDLGRRYTVSNRGNEARWLADGRLVFYSSADDEDVDVGAPGAVPLFVVEPNPDGEGPPGPAEVLHFDPRWSDTPGWSYSPSPSGGLIYSQGPDETRIHYLRVIPGWVDEMKAAVAEANR
jgi:Tol biopolymer transport system component